MDKKNYAKITLASTKFEANVIVCFVPDITIIATNHL